MVAVPRLKPQKLWNFWVKTASGLEASLYKELAALKLDGLLCFPAMFSGGVGIRDSHMRTLWHISLRSRIAERVFVQLGNPCYVKTEKDLVNHLNTIPWEDFIPFAATISEPDPIKVTIRGSQFASEKLIRKRLLESINVRKLEHISRKGDMLMDIHRRRGVVPKAPAVFVKCEGDFCETLADATGDLSNRYWRVASNGSTSFPSGNSISAALQRISFATILASDSPEILWDPLCQDGGLLLEVYGSILGYPPGTPRIRYPYFNFPTHSPSLFSQVLDLFEIRPEKVSKPLMLLGTTWDEALLNSCFENFEAFNSRKPMAVKTDKDSIEHEDSIDIRFTRGSLKQAILKPESCMIFSSIPRKSDCLDERALRSLCRQFVRQIRSTRQWKGVYVLSGRPSFKQLSGLKWQTLLRFGEGPMSVELLKCYDTFGSV